MLKLVILGLGGATGSICRYLASTMIHQPQPGDFPYGTLFVNASGSLLIGILWALADAFGFSHNTKLFLFTGLLGGYTTFSAFSLETMHLMRDGDYRFAIINMVANLFISLLAVFAGFFAMRQFL